MTLQALRGGEFTLRLVPRQKIALLYWRLDTHTHTQLGQGLQFVFMNGRVHHCMTISSSTSQNCNISYFIFDDIASLAGSVDT
jgi:hypothetical protein